MKLKTTIMAALGVAAMAAPAMAQSYYYDDDSYRDYHYRDYDYRPYLDYGPRCWYEYHRDYGLFGFVYTTHRVRVCR
jgi:hypothetical protein